MTGYHSGGRAAIPGVYWNDAEGGRARFFRIVKTGAIGNIRRIFSLFSRIPSSTETFFTLRSPQHPFDFPKKLFFFTVLKWISSWNFCGGGSGVEFPPGSSGKPPGPARIPGTTLRCLAPVRTTIKNGRKEPMASGIPRVSGLP